MRIRAVLFDLDGTLFCMEQQAFLASYFALLGKYAVSCGLSDQTPKLIYRAAMELVENPKPGVTNGENFYAIYERLSQVKPEVFLPIFETFYQTEYDLLANDVTSHPGALSAVRLCREKGLDCVVATNPLFPYIAVEKRLRWAGLEPGDFKHITHMDGCCYSKPDLRYYREILNFLGLEAGECLMVGNDAEEDMCVSALGMDSFFLTEFPICRGAQPQCPQGGFDELMEYLRAL